MDDIWILVLLSVAMFVGCYVAGSIPLALTLSEVLFLHHPTITVIWERASLYHMCRHVSACVLVWLYKTNQLQ